MQKNCMCTALDDLFLFRFHIITRFFEMEIMPNYNQ